MSSSASPSGDTTGLDAPGPAPFSPSDVRQSKIAHYFVNRTKLSCALAFVLPILSIVIIVISGSFEINSPTGNDYFIRNDIRTRLDHARDAAREQFPFEPTSAVVTRQQQAGHDRTQTEEYTGFGLHILLRGRDTDTGRVASLNDFEGVSNVFSRETFALLKKAEDEILNHTDYSRFCFRDTNQRDCNGKPRPCALPFSVLNHRYLYGKGPENNGNLATPYYTCDRRPGHELVSEDNFKKFADEMFGTEDTDARLSRLFFSNNTSPKERNSWAVYSIIPIGGPFPGFKTTDDRESEQDDLYKEWGEEVADSVNEFTNEKTDVYVISDFLGNALFDNVVIRDLSFSIAAIVLVFLVIWFHTTSAFLAGIAMLQIVLAFPFAYVIYRFILRQLYYAALQILTIFLLLGIGADDVFVFTDAWKQAAVVLGPDVDLVTRMSWTYRRAVKAMTVTSLTTAAAFFVTASSPIMPISTLGVWAGVLILLQYVLVITVYPCATVMWHRFWRPRLFVRFFQKPEPDMIETEIATPIWHRLIPRKWRPAVKPPAAGEYRPIERFFRGRWSNFLRTARFFLIPIAAILVAVSIWLATGLEPPETSEEFLPNDHPAIVAFKTLDKGFPRRDENLQLRVRVTWGIEDVDRSGTSRFDVENTGKAIFDNEFDFTKAKVQRHVLDACAFFEEEDKGLLFSDPEAIQPTTCWIRDYLDWRKKTKPNEDSFVDFESGKAQVKELLKFGADHNDRNESYLHYLEDQHVVFDTDMSKVVFTEIRFVSNVEAQVPYRIMFPEYTKWQNELEKLNKDAPDGANKAIATGGYSWMWQMTQKALVRSMFTGIGIMLVVALATLMIATMNWAVAILATLSIAGIVAMLLGVIRLLGWELGITESIGVVISIGYSFDGAAHIATAYIESKSKKRFDRTRDALTDLGISILFGVISTLLAGIMLFPAIIVFFVKFAGLIVSTLVLSLIWSLAFFPALLATVGPEDDFGSITAIARRLFGRRKVAEPETDNDVAVAA